MKQLDICERPTGEDLKERGLSIVQDHAKQWMRDAVATLDRVILPIPLTCDDLRDILKEHGIGEPHHPNAWGALARCVARNLGLKIVGYTKSRRASAHVRRIAEWGTTEEWDTTEHEDY